MSKKKHKITQMEETEEIGPKIEGILIGSSVMAESDEVTRDLYDKSRYGEPTTKKQFQYMLIESLFLLERGKFIIKKGNKELDFLSFIKYAQQKEPNFWIRYSVFRDLRRRGYIVKTALKFGADFRVYDRGVKPGEDHAKWVIFPVSEAEVFSWYEFSAKNRVAHSTRKRLLIGIVDAESDVTFMEIKWLRP